MNNEIVSSAKIFLADDRGFIENNIHRRYSTFNFDEYFNKDKEPFGDLHTFNDETLPAGGSLHQKAKSSGIIVLIPIVGGIQLKLNGGYYEAEAGEVLTVPVAIGTGYTITNPFNSNWVNFLHIELTGRSVTPKVSKYTFDIENPVNKLIPVVNDVGVSYKLSVGRFGGREEFVYTVGPGDHVFGYVIAGAFEFQNRLLHEGDGLALWDVFEVEAEALSNGAVVLLMELKAI